MNQLTFHVSGTHCASCKILIEDILSEERDISKAQVNLRKQIVEIEGDFSENPQELMDKWNGLLKTHKYTLSLEKIKKSDTKTLGYAFPLGLFILALFFLLQKSGILNLGFEGGLTPWTPFLIGLIASLSTCLAVVGGLILSLSAKVSQDVFTPRPFMFFHAGRLISFMILGGVLGALGSVIALNSTITSFLGLLAAAVMILLGIQLIDVFHFSKGMQITMPKSFSKKIFQIENGFWAPFIVGALTFFLPCGFTQAMQIAALSSGSFWQGSMIMTVFALGTLPMLGLISFSSFQFAHTKYASLFFKTAGIIVIGLGIFAFLVGLAGIGIISPLFNI